MMGTPRHRATIGDNIAGSDALHRAEMAEGSDLLRDRIFQLLADRQAKFGETVDRNEAARRDIRRGVDGAEVRRRHELSPTAYSQLAGQVRAGA